MREEFNNLYNQINTPDEWKNDIKAKMKAALLEEQKSNVVTFNDRPNRNTTIVNKKSKSKMPIAISFATVAVAAGLLIGIIVFGNSKVNLLNPSGGIETSDTSKYADVHFIDRGDILDSNALLGGIRIDDDDITSEYSFEEGEEVYFIEISENQIPKVDESDISYINNTKIIIIENNMDNQKVYSAYIVDDNMKLVGKGINQSTFLDVLCEYIKNK